MNLLLLWQWSTTVQITSALMLMVFFRVVRRTSGRGELDAWVGAWSANGLALAITSLYWLSQPVPEWSEFPVTALYVGCKTAFVLLLLIGTAAFARHARPALGKPLLAVAAGSLLLAPWLQGSIPRIGVVQCAVIVLVLGAALAECLRHRGHGLGWLALGLALRVALGLVEGACYGMGVFLPASELPDIVQTILAVHSSFDTGAEWMIALGCVLANEFRVQQDLAHSNAELQRAQESLLVAAQRDPLTGIHNRRMLPELFQAAAARGGRLVFFDVNGLKQVNDREGHAAGDRMLQRFGDALRESFADHATLRYAGDEFVAILAGDTDPAPFVEALRIRLGAGPGRAAIGFSAGTASFDPASGLREVLEEADAAMYREKQAGKADALASAG